MNEHDTLVYLKGFLQGKNFLDEKEMKILNDTVEAALKPKTFSGSTSTSTMPTREHLDEIARRVLPNTPREYYGDRHHLGGQIVGSASGTFTNDLTSRGLS